MANISGALTASSAPGNTVVLNKKDTDTQVLVTVSGTYSLSFVFEGNQDGTNWVPMASIDQGTSGVISGASAITPTANATYGWVVPCEGFTQLRIRCSAFTSGTLNVVLNSSTYSVTPLLVINNSGQTTSGWTLNDGSNIAVGSSSGTDIGTATTQKLGFYGVTPVTQPGASTDKTTGTTGASTGVSLDTTFKGSSGSTAYTIGGMLTSLKALGLVAA